MEYFQGVLVGLPTGLVGFLPPNNSCTVLNNRIRGPAGLPIKRIGPITDPKAIKTVYPGWLTYADVFNTFFIFVISLIKCYICIYK